MPAKKQQPGNRQGSCRYFALKILKRVEKQSAFAGRLLDETISKEKPEDRDRRLLYELVMGTLRWQAKLDYAISAVADRHPKKMDPTTRSILRLGAYQILFMDKIPDRAAVNETVGLSAEYARGFINKILRELVRKKDNLVWPGKEADPAERISINLSHPLWLVEKFIKDRGNADAENFCKANQTPALLTLRVNTLRTNREDLMSLLKNKKIKCRLGELSPMAVIIEEPVPPKNIPGFDEGLFAVQDEASQLVGILLGAKPGETILDACAAPGTKSLEIFQIMEKEGTLVAADIHERRLKLVSNEAKRLGLTGIKLKVADLAKDFSLNKNRITTFDRILIDAPCSGLGTLRRHPEIKWRLDPDEIKRLADKQKLIVSNLTNHLKPGGVLVYSTCTITREENQDVIEPLISSGKFQLEDAVDRLPSSARAAVSEKTLRALPHLHGTDGFTAFRFRKVRD